jgi:hypothetical protein
VLLRMVRTFPLLLECSWMRSERTGSSQVENSACHRQEVKGIREKASCDTKKGAPGRVTSTQV